MSDPSASAASTPTGGRKASGSGSARIIGIITMIVGIVMVVAGAFTWVVVQQTLADQKIVVSDDADMFAGSDVNGPFTAYSQAMVIGKHATEAAGGKTYAELDRDDPNRDTVMNASFLQASLFTSVVAFGVAFMAFVLGIVLALIGSVLMKLPRAA